MYEKQNQERQNLPILLFLLLTIQDLLYFCTEKLTIFCYIW